MKARKQARKEGFYKIRYKAMRAGIEGEPLFFFCLTACWTSDPQPGIESTPLAVRVQSPSHWTAKEVLHILEF